MVESRQPTVTVSILDGNDVIPPWQLARREQWALDRSALFNEAAAKGKLKAFLTTVTLSQRNVLRGRFDIDISSPSVVAPPIYVSRLGNTYARCCLPLLQIR